MHNLNWRQLAGRQHTGRQFVVGVVLLAFVVGLATVRSVAVNAQTPQPNTATNPTVVLAGPDMQNFPTLGAYLGVKDAQGQFIYQLEPGMLSAIEDGDTLSVQNLELQKPGAQFVIAVNPGASFAERNPRGVSRSVSILQTLQDWAMSRQGSTLDDLSLVTSSSGEATHLNNPLKLNAALSSALNLQPNDLRQAAPNLDVLLRAIDVAADTPPRHGMGRAVLFITPPIEDQAEVAVQNIVARAKEQGVSIYTWLVPGAGGYYPNSEKQFKELAAQTGGGYFKLTDERPNLDIESFLDTFRSVYHLTYNSQIRASGAHQLAVDIKTPSGSITSPVQSFELNIQPPEPAFVSPPMQIQRTPPVDSAGKVISDAPLTDYLPQQQDIKMLVSFPDERIRPLIRTTLFVDGKVVQENRQPPFDQFTWNLMDLTTSGAHMIRVEAEDSLGMTGASIERLVEVNLAQPTRNPWAWAVRNAPALSILGAVVAGAILLLVLLLGGRLRPRQFASAKMGRRKSDPVTQPVSIKVEPPARRLSGLVNRIHWPQRSMPPQAYAFLCPENSYFRNMVETDIDTTAAPIPLTVDDITLGSDPNRAKLVLNDPSVEGLHARIVHQGEGQYRLLDEGSIAGTWINYTPISREGVALEHGDLIHIGRVGFRFTTRRPGQIRRPVITSGANSVPRAGPPREARSGSRPDGEKLP